MIWNYVPDCGCPGDRGWTENCPDESEIEDEEICKQCWQQARVEEG